MTPLFFKNFPLQDLSGSIVDVRVVVAVVTDVVVEEENKGEMVSVRLTSVSEVVSNVDESDVVINSILFSLLFAWDFTAVVTKYPVVDIAPATTRNFKMNFMRLAHFLGFSEPF